MDNEIKAGRRWEKEDGRVVVVFGPSHDLQCCYEDERQNSQEWCPVRSDYEERAKNYTRLPDDPTLPGWVAEKGAMLKICGGVWILKRQTDVGWMASNAENNMPGYWTFATLSKLIDEGTTMTNIVSCKSHIDLQHEQNNRTEPLDMKVESTCGTPEPEWVAEGFAVGDRVEHSDYGKGCVLKHECNDAKSILIQYDSGKTSNWAPGYFTRVPRLTNLTRQKSATWEAMTFADAPTISDVFAACGLEISEPGEDAIETPTVPGTENPQECKMPVRFASGGIAKGPHEAIIGKDHHDNGMPIRRGKEEVVIPLDSVKGLEKVVTNGGANRIFNIKVGKLDQADIGAMIAHYGKRDALGMGKMLCLRGCGQMVSADPHEQRMHWQGGKCFPKQAPVDLEELRRQTIRDIKLEEEQLKIGTTETDEDVDFESWED